MALLKILLDASDEPRAKFSAFEAATETGQLEIVEYLLHLLMSLRIGSLTRQR